MTPEKEKELIAIYPPIFTDMNELEPFAMFGFECSDGWFDLLKECIEEIKHVCEREVAKGHPNKVKMTQAKEKFGILSIHVEGVENKIYNAIHQAQAKSHVTCEKCGARGTVRNGGWIQTLCDKCHEKQTRPSKRIKPQEI